MDETANIVLEAGGTEVPTPAGGARRYRKPLKSFRWCDIKYMVGESTAGWNKHKAPRLGAALAFYTLLSLAPLLLVVVSVVGLIFGVRTAENDVVQEVQRLIGPEAGKTIQGLLEASRNTSQGILATVFGVITLLFGASGVMIELRDALNTIWEVPTPELSGMRMIISFLKERVFSFALVLAIGFLLVVSLAISAAIAALGALSASVLPAHEIILHVVNSLISLGYSQLARLAWWTMSKSTILITTSGTSSTLWRVCLVLLSRTLRAGEKIRMGGVEENMLKKLNGLRFTLPVLSMVLAKQTGLGAMAYCR